ncbi:hypothetical protein [Streptomyces sp. NPDC101234]|uniref:hypothetical protein n=1 Tax=Streptomyces sp. NPDC101234 TaxID=3366138 RepID=UPI00380A8C64
MAGLADTAAYGMRRRWCSPLRNTAGTGAGGYIVTVPDLHPDGLLASACVPGREV